ncbi:putative iron-regulated protein [Plasticicumulans lactativorans]|uniref:Putative iron-regulated protein n=1 Tax=Plasticicumulans lactativorans TaxID=1133106 RepID=A0A4R2LAZ3_9GAMM|nr:imelysin family protein [Plasticicumulans lactativorans]TCO83480.1 putative iron-regulated protein [Plasticicumulans lactativorans]
MFALRPALLALALAGAALNTHAATPPVTEAAVVSHYAELVYANYSDALAGARAVQAAVQRFVAAPSAEGLVAARRAWLAAREAYGQTEAFRFYAGPIDAEDGPEGRINAWPLDESYIDYVKGKPKAGIINDPRVTISADNLARLNEKGGEENVATGWHAIEFLLWGQDFSKDGPGNRPYTDYVDGGGAPNPERRRLYLATVADLLVADLDSVTRAWTPGVADNYRARFVAEPPRASLKKILIGLGSLSRAELAGERMEVALDNRDQEDEHSCFSDNTHRDIVANASGIRNVYSGRYTRADGSVLEGPGVQALLATVDAPLAERLGREIDAAVVDAAAIHAPFDREIVNPAGRKRVAATVKALKVQTATLVQAARALGIPSLNVSG